RANRQRSGDPVDARVRVGSGECVAQGAGTGVPASRELGWLDPPLALDHAGRAIVDIFAGTNSRGERRERIAESSLRAGEGELVGLCEMQDHVGDVPAVAT